MQAMRVFINVCVCMYCVTGNADERIQIIKGINWLSTDTKDLKLNRGSGTLSRTTDKLSMLHLAL